MRLRLPFFKKRPRIYVYNGVDPIVLVVDKDVSKDIFDSLLKLYHAGYASGWDRKNRWQGTHKRVARTHSEIKDLLKIRVYKKVIPAYEAPEGYER